MAGFPGWSAQLPGACPGQRRAGCPNAAIALLWWRTAASIKMPRPVDWLGSRADPGNPGRLACPPAGRDRVAVPGNGGRRREALVETKRQYDIPSFRHYCRAQAAAIVDQLVDYSANGYRLVALLGIDGSPSCGIRTCGTDCDAGGPFHIPAPLPVTSEASSWRNSWRRSQRVGYPNRPPLACP